MEVILSSPLLLFATMKLSKCTSVTPRAIFPSSSNFSRPLSMSPSIRLPAGGSISRKKLSYVTAATMQDKDEKRAVADTFHVETVLVNEEALVNRNPVANSPGMVTRWAIKIEQSFNFFLTESAVRVMDMLYADRHYARFFVLETIARVPYFAFISVLHMYESFGWWRRVDYLKVHFAESWNEMHHLLIMEALGGNSFWFDRFVAQHIAVVYYLMTAFMYALSPRMAYHFSECVERHAYSTYDKFLKIHEEELKTLPAPEVAIQYYTGEDLYFFDEFQTDRIPETRRPKIENLYDVFVNIRDDEAEHCKTMKVCQMHGNLRSPHRPPLKNNSGECVHPGVDGEGIIDCIKKSLAPHT